MTPALKSLRSAVKLTDLSDKDFIEYVKWHYPPSVVSDLVGIQQTSGAFRQPKSSRPAKTKVRRARRAVRTRDYGRVERYITHAVVLAVSMAIVARNPVPLIVMLGVGVAAVAVLFGAKDAVNTLVAFSVRGRSKTGSYEVTVRVRTSSWNNTTVGRVLSLVSIFLPPEYRAEYVEDQYANLLAAESHRERFDYLIGQILELPSFAWQFWAEHKRQSVK